MAPFLFTHVGEPDGTTSIRAQFGAPVGDVIAPIIFDLFNAFRSALDHAVYAATVSVTKKPKPRSTKFPFGETEAGARSEFGRGAADVPLELQDVLVASQPFRLDGTDNLLWSFNKIRNRGVHRLIEPTIPGLNSIEIGPSSIHRALRISWKLAISNQWDEKNNALELVRVRDATNDLNVRVSLALAFGAETELAGKQLRQILPMIKVKVQSIVDQIAKKTNELVAT